MRKACLFILTLGILFFLAACSAKTEQSGTSGDGLVMCTLESGAFFKDTAGRFSEKNKGKSIRVETISMDRYHEYGDRLAARLSAGLGPDIITFQYYGAGNTFSTFLKYIPKGLLCDLNELVEKNRDLKLEDYHKGALESGVFNGKRYFIPLSFNVDVFFATEEALEENHINFDEDNWNWKTILKYVRDFQERGRSHFFGWSDYLKGLVGNWGTHFLDAGGGLSSFKSAEVEELLETYRRLAGTVTWNSRDETTILRSENVYGFYVLSNLISRSSGVLRAYPVPSASGGMGGSAVPNLAVAISSSCPDKKTAYQYIKYLLSEEAQSIIPNLSMSGFPVSKKAYEEQKERVLEERAAIEEFRQLLKQVDRIITEAGRYEILDETMLGIIKANAEGYVSGKQTAAEAGVLIDEGIEKYYKSVTVPAYVETENNEESGTEQKIEKVLKIYYVDWGVSADLEYVKHVINKYKSKYKDVRLDETVFTKESDLSTRLTTDLLAGEGPDVILFKPDTINSLHKVMENGIFAELDPLIEADGEFNLSDYYEKVLDYGIYKGKRYFIPIDYYMPVFITTEGILEKNNIKIDESNWTWDELARITDEFMKRNEGKDKYMFDGLYFAVMWSGLPLIDYENRQVNLTSPEFIKYLENLDKAQKGILPLEKYRAMKFDDLYFELLNGTCVMLYSYDEGNLSNVCLANSWTNHILKENLKIIPMPSVNGDGKYYPVLNQCVAINDKCEYKEDAFNMIKVFLSLEHQASLSVGSDHMYAFGWPVYKRAFPIMKEIFRTSPEVKYQMVRRGKLMTYPVEEEVAAQVERIIENLETGCFIDYEIQKIIGEELAFYSQGRKTLEKALQDAENKVKLYLNE